MPWTVPELVFAGVVTLQICLLAYTYRPAPKAFIASMPVPFTAAVLSTGQRIDFTHAAGMFTLILFILLAIHLHRDRGLNLPLAEGAAVLAYCGIALVLNRAVPEGRASFFCFLVLSWAACLCLLKLLPPRAEPGHRSDLPLYLKVPVVAGLVLVMVGLKQHFSGFVAGFPYVTVFAVYEMRTCLRTLTRQMIRFVLCFNFMVLLLYLLQDRMRPALLFACGWAVFFAAMLPVRRVSRDGLP
jgi:hypothetical protein